MFDRSEYFFIKTVGWLFELIVLMLSPIASFFPRSKKKFNLENKPVVVILHGWGSGRMIYRLLARHVEGLGYAVFVPQFPLRAIGDIPSNANFLKKEIDRLEITTSFVILGHSTGGIIGAQFLENNPGMVSMFVTMSSPFHGTKTAWTASWFSRAARQLSVDSEYLKHIGAHTSLRNVDLICFYPTFDEVVIPATSATLPFARNIKLSIIGHMSFLYSKTFFESLENILLKQ
jgi:pimeloyl-ACP methyl ester carboxylesterase